MSKITKEIRYRNMSFNFIRETKQLKMYFNEDSSYGIIVDKYDSVLFEIKADCGQNFGYLEDGLE